MTVTSAVGDWDDKAEHAVTFAEFDASIGSGPEVPEDEVAVRYYSDEALLASIRLRRSGHTCG